MVIRPAPFTRARRRRGSISVELTVAMGLLIAAVLPLSVSFLRDARALRGQYHRAVALEIVDGEMEILAAGEWRTFPPGQHAYQVKAGAATNLPPGTFTLTVTSNRLRLLWQPAARGQGGPVTREIRRPSGPAPATTSPP
jgi:hypothetical protein